jgi:hypothetical protein
VPDANDRIPPTFYSLSAERWERIFGDENSTLDKPEFDIVWTPDPSLDGAHFTPE